MHQSCEKKFYEKRAVWNIQNIKFSYWHFCTVAHSRTVIEFIELERHIPWAHCIVTQKIMKQIFGLYHCTWDIKKVQHTQKIFLMQVKNQLTAVFQSIKQNELIRTTPFRVFHKLSLVQECQYCQLRFNCAIRKNWNNEIFNLEM